MRRHLHRLPHRGDPGLRHPSQGHEDSGGRREVIRWVLTAAACAALLTGCDPKEPATSGGPAEVRRLTEAEYRQTIADIFGDDIKVAGRFEPDMRADGLLAVGTAKVTVTPAGLEQYDAMAHGIAAQVVDQKHRDRLI